MEKTFPPPHGDKFQLRRGYRISDTEGFRPLTGINFNSMKLLRLKMCIASFRPLTGINFNQQRCATYHKSGNFRPLTGINFNGKQA